MFMSVIDNTQTSAIYGELAGTRVMVTGLTPACGVDIARAFADHKTRLVLQSSAAGDPEMTAVLAMLTETAHEIRDFDTQLDGAPAAHRFAQAAAQVYGSLDTVINIVPVAAAELNSLDSFEDIERMVSGKLDAALAITRTAANRMKVMLTEGSILNVVLMDTRAGGRAALVAGVLRSTLAAMTRREAEACAGHGIRINAIGPASSMPGAPAPAALASEPEMAAVALYLASRRARGLSGHVFDAEGSLTRCE